MKKIFNYSAILISLIVFSAFSLNYGKKIDLKLNLQKGDKFYVLTVSEQDITQSMMGQEIKIAQTIRMGSDYDVVDVLKNGDFNIKVTYQRIAYRQDSQYASVDYDSDKPDAEVSEQAKAFAALKGISFSFICDEKGNVSNVTGTDEMLDKIIASYGSELTESKKEAVKKSLEMQFGDEALKSTLSSLMNIYPEKPVKTGSSWSRMIELNVGMPIVLDNTWKLNSVKKGQAFVSINTVITANSAAEPMEIQGMTMKYELKGSQEGELIIDIETGLTKSSIMNQKLSGKMLMSGGMLPEAMEVPIQIETKASVTMEKK